MGKHVLLSCINKILGCILFILGLVLHTNCHKYHKKAHDYSSNIEEIVKTGPFGIIRHPMYLSLIAMYWGLAIGWEIIWIIAPAIVFSLLVILIAWGEERLLLSELGEQYQDYMRRVPWRFIPKIF